MVNYREILRLDSLHYSQRQIATSVHSSRGTVSEVLHAAQRTGIHWPLGETVTNTMLLSTFFPERYTASKSRVEPDYPAIHQELARSGVNLTLLWTEYSEKCRQAGQKPYMYTQFCDKYRRWAQATKATMRIQHKPGDAMQVDWAGSTIPIHNPETGEAMKTYLFIAVLPCSCLVYAQACVNMGIESWLDCHVHAYAYYGGVTRLLIPDNLKTGVRANTRDETILNRSYQEMAEHYGTAIVPARVSHPQDKGTVEGSVKYASTWITAALRDQKFFTIEAVNRAIAEKLEELNHRPFQKRTGCRASAYRDEEQVFMKPLPREPFEPAVWTIAKVPRDYLITDGPHRYSVPFDLIGEMVDVRLTRTTVEAFWRGSRVASHPRLTMVSRGPIIKMDHMPDAHRKYLAYNSEDFLRWAKRVGEYTLAVIRYFLTADKEPEQGFKSCASLSRLADKVGHERIERACERVLFYTKEPSIRIIRSILKNGQDRMEPAESTHDSIPETHGITRGAAYFSRKGDSSDD